jgi:hypothetical protein
LAWLLGVSSPYLTFVTDEEPSQTAISCQVWASLSACIPLARLGKTSLQKVIIAGYAAPEENKAGGNKETGMSTIARYQPVSVGFHSVHAGRSDQQRCRQHRN